MPQTKRRPIFEESSKLGWTKIEEVDAIHILQNADHVSFSCGEILSKELMFDSVESTIKFNTIRCTNLRDQELKAWLRLHVKKPAL